MQYTFYNFFIFVIKQFPFRFNITPIINQKVCQWRLNNIVWIENIRIF